VKASDITDDEFVAAVRASAQDLAQAWGREYVESDKPYLSSWAMAWEVADRLDVPVKVARAKFLRCQKRGLVHGCGCGCRGDWHVLARPFGVPPSGGEE
jgi:hypothetical protein